MTTTTSSLSPLVYEKLCALVYDRAGILLGAGKEQLVASRVSRRMAQVGVSKMSQYLAMLEGSDKEQELVHFIDVITTNFTSFFREEKHFDLLDQWVTKNFILGTRKLRVWSAACSSGEEPYTLAMSLLDRIGNRDVDLKILATDISTQVLHTAREGVYLRKQLAGIPEKYRARFCSTQNNSHSFTIADEAKRVVIFRRLNLSTPPYPLRGPLDAIFCRNVMIYFDDKVRQRLLGEFQKLLRPGGLLFIGHSESISSLDSRFRVVVPSVYVNEGGSHRDARS